MKIKEWQIILNQKIETKKRLFTKIAEVAYDNNLTSSIKSLEQGLWDREKEGTTGMSDGFAIPHCKIKEIKEPSILVFKLENSINDYETIDGKDVKIVVALLIPEKSASKVQIKLLSALALKLGNKTFSQKLKQASTKREIIDLFTQVNFESKAPKTIDSKKAKLKIVGITSCAAGIAHTYIARDKLIEAGKEKGYKVRIETQGAVGSEDTLTKQEINEADYVIIASDIDVDLSRFSNKKLYRDSVHKAVKDANQYIEKSIKKASLYKNLQSSDSQVIDAAGNKKFITHIMNGISWMIPLLVAAAILIAIPSIAGAIVDKSEIVTSGDWQKMVDNNLDSPIWKFMYFMIKIGWQSISLMFPIFAAFTAFSIGSKPAFIPGLIGGFLSKPGLLYNSAFKDWFTSGYPYLDKTSGFWGALIIGILIGYIIKYANQWIKIHKKIQAIKPMLILPTIGVLSSVCLMVLAINPAFGLLNEQLIDWAKSAGKSSEIILAIVIAPMTASDLGGPINKAAVTTMYQFYESRTFSLTIRVIPTITPSIGLGIAAIIDKFLVGRRVFDDDVRLAAPNSIILALLGISEGALPFLFKRPWITMPINMLGGFFGSVTGVLTGTEQWFPDSAIWAWPFASPVWGMLLGIAVGSLSTALMHIYFRYFLSKLGKIQINAKYNLSKGIVNVKKVKTK